MTPEQKIKWAIINVACDWDEKEPPEVNDENIEELYDQLCEEDKQWDGISELREGQVETDIHCESSRYYESKSVASQMPDGSWVGWTYWYGGGKHGEPEAIDWMDDAYDLNCLEEEKVVTIRTFTKLESK